MPGGSGEGLKQALDAHQAADQLADQPAEASLFDDTDVTGNVAAASPLSALFEPKGPGRPKGSRNRMTVQTAQWLLSQHRHPLQVLAEAYSMSPHDLARRIGLKPGYWHQPPTPEKGERPPAVWVDRDEFDPETLLAIFKMQMGFATDLAPYVAKKQPMAIDLSAGAGGDFSLVFAGVSLPARGGPAEPTGGPVIDQPALRLPGKSDG